MGAEAGLLSSRVSTFRETGIFDVSPPSGSATAWTHVPNASAKMIAGEKFIVDEGLGGGVSRASYLPSSETYIILSALYFRLAGFPRGSVGALFPQITQKAGFDELKTSFLLIGPRDEKTVQVFSIRTPPVSVSMA